MTSHSHPTAVRVYRTDLGSLQRSLALVISLTLCAALVAVRVDDGRLRTLVLLIIGTCWADRAISALARELGDPALLRLKYALAVKLMLLLAMLYGGWTPFLHIDAPNYGYDPQRYYFQAQELAASNFDFSVMPGLNFTGILFYYAGLFRTFGYNPAAPALVNCFTTLWASLVLLRTAYDYVPVRRSWDWILGLVILVPEIVWYDALTSRESICLAFVTIVVLTALRLVLPAARGRLGRGQVVGALIAIVALAVIRPPMLLIPAASAAMFVVLAPRRVVARPLLMSMLAVVLGLVLWAAPIVTETVLGSDEFSFSERIDVANALETAREEGFSYSERSIGMLVQSDKPIVLGMLAPVRIVIYLIAPLPSINATWAGYLGGDWESHQAVYVAASSLLYLAVFPLALAALFHALRSGDRVVLLALQTPFWIAMVAIALGNQIIHERYRITAMMLFALVLWIGARTPRFTRESFYGLWLGAIASGGVFFVVFKYLR